jgi:hypothetical protein
VQSGAQQELASPARMQVGRYLKGHGPRIVRVDTGITAHRGRVTVSEDGIAPVAGQRWKLYLGGRRSPYRTSICAGSRPLAAGPP